MAGELKSIITIIMFLMMITQTTWDAISTSIKYKEGFMALPDGRIIQKPFDFWAREHQQPIQAIDYVECVTFSFHTGVFFLMQCFWNYLSNSVARKSFMGSFEFKFYIFWAMGSMAMFPILQWVYRNDELNREIVPQLAYGIEVLITALLGVRSHLRFRRIIAMTRRGNKNAAIINKLSYFRDMNVMLVFTLISYGASFVIMCVDGLTPAKVISQNKFASDVLIANANMCVVFLWLLFICIFHPRRQYATNVAISTRSDSESQSIQPSKGSEMLGEVHHPHQQQQRYSGRITNFIASNDMHQRKQPTMTSGPGETLYPKTVVDTATPAGFMRPMSPVAVDYPQSLYTDTSPLTDSSAGRPFSPPSSSTSFQAKPAERNVSIEDPYTSEPITFSMIDPTIHYPSERRPSSPHSTTLRPQEHDAVEIPMHTIQSLHTFDERRSPLPPVPNTPPFRRNDSQSHAANPMNHTTDPAAAGQHAITTIDPSLPSPAGGSRDRMVRDWLWQSPDRRL
ncbi:uncharacterized protein BYT42DRAFT_261655 [Radiomyces spectabilis]|uniref:uncharacterized protein n=1 Tax=Radiomyces spectabilis TaxID=64574 RepID=UPI00221EC565|nr:uncharacterized protein BYT42DRAFT_261655 [Radiomyces spectabilis]KAI8384455.1 hypothetical protein BYT42DRAFT_261655 [Radiomyces spectabilis]